jgi:RNase H-like domain found in reverse transcriptase/Reverse transcriptase (RNA-dependent DNA polymerase)/Zinc knuckle
MDGMLAQLPEPKGPCFHCGKMGHFIRDCRSRQKGSTYSHNSYRPRAATVIPEDSISYMDTNEDDMRSIPSPIHHSLAKGPNRRTIPRRERLVNQNDGSKPGFYPSLIRSALIKRTQTSDVYILSRKSMTVRFFVHTKSKRAEALALVDSGATENFMNLDYACYLRLPIQCLTTPQKLYNVDGTSNQSGDLLYYTDLSVQTGSKRINLRFFLSNLGENKAILGYPWFAAMQPQIDWRRGWIDHSQLPIIFRTPDAAKARFLPRTTNVPRESSALRIRRLHICTPNPKPQIPQQYRAFERVFSKEASHKFPPSRPWDHAIDLKPGAPAALPGKLIPLSQTELGVLRKFVKEHLTCGTIRPSKSPYKSRFFFIQKKDGTLRAVQDYRPVNQWTIRNAYPLPLIPELIDRLNGCSLYTKFDIHWGYNNVRIKEGDEWKATFITNEGLFEPTVMFFGLTNSPTTFQTMMNSIFSEEVAERWMTIYMDDMAIHTKRREGETKLQHILCHRSYVCRVLAKLLKHNLFLKPEKCTFEQPSIEFLGVQVSEGTVHMDDVKVEKVRKWLPPSNVTEVRKFLGFTGYYRYFIKDYSKITKPLLLLTHNTTPWHWNDEQQQAFEKLRDLMCQQPVLKQPDFTKPFAVFTDASAYGVGAILSQEGGPNTQNRTKHHPIAYYSATFTETERNYNVYDRELLAIMKVIIHWRPYLIWTKEPFKIFTDHANLLHWKSPRKLNRRTARWHGEL